MKIYFPTLSSCTLFEGISNDALSAMLDCLGASVLSFSKGKSIFLEGDPATRLGILLSGTAQITRVDYDGNRSIVATLGAGELFGESFACAGVARLPVSVEAVSDAEVMLIDSLRITKTCTNACEFHSRIIYNLMRTLAQKNLQFNSKLEITSKRSTREKLIAFLFAEARKHSSKSFSIPYDRQSLADYLGVDRSGLSAEIGKLCREGIIACEKNRFELLDLSLR